MNRKTILILAAALVLLALAVGGGLAAFQPAPVAPDAVYSIPWWSVDGGGGTSSGGTFSLSGSAGQPDAGTSTGGVYSLTGGFWSGQPPYRMYLPALRR